MLPLNVHRLDTHCPRLDQAQHLMDGTIDFMLTA